MFGKTNKYQSRPRRGNFFKLALVALVVGILILVLSSCPVDSGEVAAGTSGFLSQVFAMLSTFLNYFGPLLVAFGGIALMVYLIRCVFRG